MRWGLRLTRGRPSTDAAFGQGRAADQREFIIGRGTRLQRDLAAAGIKHRTGTARRFHHGTNFSGAAIVQLDPLRRHCHGRRRQLRRGGKLRLSGTTGHDKKQNDKCGFFHGAIMRNFGKTATTSANCTM